MADKLSIPTKDSTKVDWVDLGSTTDITTAWDKLTIYDRPVIVTFSSSDAYYGILYKYSGSNFGMGFVQPYYSTHMIIMSVVNGVKTVKNIEGQ